MSEIDDFCKSLGGKTPIHSILLLVLPTSFVIQDSCFLGLLAEIYVLSCDM
ncbi:hypothetical protein C4D60_Mb10t11290 [Musa balbisiana]|uniref:Uncharacterized protein n=1 Tax=Musa balbisiana TaxID=52838 RepID=A0A4S8IYS6_MUSBA|nr:hypothetical protein C4D60_Mb10t11290 [Musa balbisiana]